MVRVRVRVGVEVRVRIRGADLFPMNPLQDVMARAISGVPFYGDESSLFLHLLMRVTESGSKPLLRD